MTNEKSIVLSLDIFKEFIQLDENGNFIKQRILTIECYRRWLGARRKVIKKPTMAFINSISAHLRGVKTPFQVQVEDSILRELRKVNNFGKPIDAYDFLRRLDGKQRRPTAVSVLTYKFPYGYHEKHSKKRRKRKTGKKKNFKGNLRSVETSAVSTHTNTEHSDKEGNIQPIFTIAKVSKTPEALRDVAFEDLSYVNKILNLDITEIHRIEEVLQKLQLCVSFPAISYLLETVGRKSYYLSKEFVLPQLHEQFFRQDRTFFGLKLCVVPIAEILICRTTGVFQYMNAHFMKIFGGIKNGLFYTTTITEYFNVLRYIKQVLHEKGECWMRSTVLVNGVRFISKNYARTLDGNIDQVFLQIITDTNIPRDSSQFLLL
eukprot:snap_masked-scaffold_15-processed-gene-1.20-mRNA-1 protein AED:1.00 eAED:1.00 QI:0/0/0/0/1/1/4/0/374